MAHDNPIENWTLQEALSEIKRLNDLVELKTLLHQNALKHWTDTMGDLLERNRGI